MAKSGKGLKARGREEADFVRPIKFRNYQYFFLIVCEDEKTEPSYFEKYESQIPDNTFFLRRIGTGLDPKGVVERTVAEREKLKQESRKEIDESWAVFDKDDADENVAKVQRFEEAFALANQDKIELGYSNEAFELWLLLHLTNVSYTKPLARKEIYQKLEEEITRRPGFHDFKYKHGDIKILELIEQLGDENAAISRAETLYDVQKNKPPIQANPSTRIHLLVKSLKDKIAFYAWKLE